MVVVARPRVRVPARSRESIDALSRNGRRNGGFRNRVFCIACDIDQPLTFRLGNLKAESKGSETGLRC